MYVYQIIILIINVIPIWFRLDTVNINTNVNIFRVIGKSKLLFKVFFDCPKNITQLLIKFILKVES